jgi:hypothetical protein
LHHSELRFYQDCSSEIAGAFGRVGDSRHEVQGFCGSSDKPPRFAKRSSNLYAASLPIGDAK